MIPIETIETERLTIRIFTQAHYDYLFHHESKEMIMKTLGHLNDEEYQMEKDKHAGGLSSYNRTFIFFKMFLKSTNHCIGGCGLHNWFAMHRRAEIGYNLNADEHKQKGFMKETVKAVINYGFNEMNLNRIEAYTSLNNIASIKTLESAGFLHEGIMHEHYQFNDQIEDSTVYYLLRSKYLNQ